MLENIDLCREISKAAYRRQKAELDLKWGGLQRRARTLGIPVLIVFEGWGASGKGTLINQLILPLDPRGFNVYSMLPPNEEEQRHPFLWRFWIRTPARGRIAVCDRSWYRRVTNDRVDGTVDDTDLRQAVDDINSFERQLADDGTVIVKFLLHISKREQKRRFAKLQDDPATAWRVTKDDLRRHRQYRKYLAAFEDMLAQTDTECAPWTVVEAHDHRFATLKVFKTCLAAVERRVTALEDTARRRSRRSEPPATEEVGNSILDRVDLTLAMEEEEYRRKLKVRQNALRELEYRMYRNRVPAVIAFEGWDAAGKGGCIKRLAENLDPRDYEVVPFGAPTDTEKAHHHLWRFWLHMPKTGHLTIFDRTWYDRVLVERIEGFCSEAEWRRGYREINEMEEHLANAGTVLVKFWLHIDAAEQLRRFKDRTRTPEKQWKITADDWRNRANRAHYTAAVEDMLRHTDTPHAPWTVVEANCKRYARIKVLDTVIAAITRVLDR